MRKSFFLLSRRNVGARIKDCLKLMVGAIVYPVQSRRWLRFVRSNAVLSELAQRYPRIRHKIYRPYLCGRLACAERIDVLMAHYRYMFNAGLADLIGQAALSPLPLAEFCGKSETVFQLHLSAINDGHREGGRLPAVATFGFGRTGVASIVCHADIGVRLLPSRAIGAPCLASAAL
jgi:uncharacterized protein VirK/YbjX